MISTTLAIFALILLVIAWLGFDRGLTSVQAWQDQAEKWWRSMVTDAQPASSAAPSKAQYVAIDTILSEPEPEPKPEPQPVGFSTSNTEIIPEGTESKVEAVSELVQAPASEPMYEEQPSPLSQPEPEHALESDPEDYPDPEFETVLAAEPEPEPEPEPELTYDPQPEAAPQMHAELVLELEAPPEPEPQPEFAKLQGELPEPESQALHSSIVTMASMEQLSDMTESSNLYISFAFDSASLSEEAKNTLDEIAKAFIQSDSSSIWVTGYADKDGNQNYNLALSRRRADAAAQYLVTSGIDAGSLTVQGLGIYDGIDTGSPESTVTQGIHGRIVQLELQIASNSP